MLAARVVKDEGMLRIPRGAGGHHDYSAARAGFLTISASKHAEKDGQRR